MLNLEFMGNSAGGHVTWEPGVLISFSFALTWSFHSLTLTINEEWDKLCKVDIPGPYPQGLNLSV